MKLPYFSYKEAMQECYGEALFSIPVNLEFGCPNRDKQHQGGCTFCPEHGARAAQIANAKTVEEQIQKALSFAKRRYKARRFSLYIQAYTGTFASLALQKETYIKLLKLYPFDAIHIGTRPDCLSTSTLDLLQELNQTIDVVVELGIQTLHDASLRQMNRGHDAKASIRAIGLLRERGIRVYGHLILGWPNESFETYRDSLRGIIDAGIQGIKFHNLHVIEKTQLAEEYAKNPFALMDEYTYAEALIALLRYVPSTIPILRLSTDTPNHELVAPKWHMSKGQFQEYVVQTMRYRGISQGDFLEPQADEQASELKIMHLADGSIGAWNSLYKEYYHPKAGAYRYSRELFVDKSSLKERLQQKDVRILEIGLGMGYTLFEILHVAQQSSHHLHVTTIDQDRMVLRDAMNVVPLKEHQEMLNALFERGVYATQNVDVSFINQEARFALRHLKTPYDLIFVDPFLESNNASLVSYEFFVALKKVLAPEGCLVTSTKLYAVQAGLIEAGFDVDVYKDETSDIQGLIASPSSRAFHNALKEPYRDPYGVWSDKQIESFHQQQN